MEFNEMVLNKVEEGDWLIIEDINGIETDFQIKCAGADSKAFKAKYREMDDKARTKRKGLTATEKEKYALKAYAACVLDWKGIEKDGKPMKCTIENVMDVFKNAPYVYDQVGDFIGERSNFL